MRAAILVMMATTYLSLSAEDAQWQFEGWAGPSFSVRMFSPDDANVETKIVIVMHGASRDAQRYYKDWKALAKEHNLIIVVPEFTKQSFQKSARYNLGHVFDPNTGRQRAEELWTFSAIEPLFDAVVARIVGEQTSYTIYGHSAGSQFVHRFMYYKPDARVDRYIAANAGWYTLPVMDFKYPYGFVDSGLGDTDLPEIFSKPLFILLGRKDTDPDAKSLRKTAEAERQGPNRLVRGLTMYREAKAMADELGAPFNWQLFVVNGADHDNAKMAPVAAEIAAQ